MAIKVETNGLLQRLCFRDLQHVYLKLEEKDEKNGIGLPDGNDGGAWPRNDRVSLNNHKSRTLYARSRAILKRKSVPLQSDLGRDLESPLNQGVNSGVFGRTWWFVNRWFESPRGNWFPKGACVRLTSGS